MFLFYSLMERFSPRLCIEKSGESALFLLIGAALTIINMIKQMSQSCPSVWCQNKIWKAEWNCFVNGTSPKTMPVSGCSSKKDLRLPEAAPSDSADQTVALTHAEFSARLTKKDLPWLYRDQKRGALGSCVHPHRPWSKSHTLSDEGEVETVAARRSEEEAKG